MSPLFGVFCQQRLLQLLTQIPVITRSTRLVIAMVLGWVCYKGCGGISETEISINPKPFSDQGCSFLAPHSPKS